MCDNGLMQFFGMLEMTFSYFVSITDKVSSYLVIETQISQTSLYVLKANLFWLYINNVHPLENISLNLDQWKLPNRYITNHLIKI